MRLLRIILKTKKLLIKRENYTKMKERKYGAMIMKMLNI